MHTKLLDILRAIFLEKSLWVFVVKSFVFMTAGFFLLFGKQTLDILAGEHLIEYQKQVEQEMIVWQKKVDSLNQIILAQQRIRDAEYSITSRVRTKEITDRLAIDLKALRVHVIKVHNHGALEAGIISDMSIFTEGVYDSDTRPLINEWDEEPMPMGFVRHIDFMIPKDNQQMDPYYRYRYVPDVSRDSLALAGPVSLGMLQEMKHKSVLTFWITTNNKGEFFFLNVAYNYPDPAKNIENLIPITRSGARAVARVLESQ